MYLNHCRLDIAGRLVNSALDEAFSADCDWVVTPTTTAAAQDFFYNVCLQRLFYSCKLSTAEQFFC